MKRKIEYTDEKYFEMKDKWMAIQKEVGNTNSKTLSLFRDIIEDSLSWFSREISGKNITGKVSENIKVLNENCELPHSTNSLLIHFNKVRNELAHPSPPKLGEEDYMYFNKKTKEFIKYFKPEELSDDFEPATAVAKSESNDAISSELEEHIYDENDPSYIGRYGRYRINGTEFISIYGFKKMHNLTQGNNGSDSINLLNSKTENRKAIPEVGAFNIVRVFPVDALKEFFKIK